MCFQCSTARTAKGTTFGPRMARPPTPARATSATWRHRWVPGSSQTQPAQQDRQVGGPQARGVRHMGPTTSQDPGPPCRGAGRGGARVDGTLHLGALRSDLRPQGRGKHGSGRGGSAAARSTGSLVAGHSERPQPWLVLRPSSAIEQRRRVGSSRAIPSGTASAPQACRQLPSVRPPRECGRAPPTVVPSSSCSLGQISRRSHLRHRSLRLVSAGR